ncbi:MAG: hypothetical protein QOH10_2762 [Actinomycetota bacterium]|nr:hypothetical protein [Actinomycetota bacterium]
MGRGRGCGRSDLTSDVVESERPTPDDESISEPRVDFSERAAIWVFAAVEAGAFVFYLVLARSEWFFLDEWDFVAGRGMGVHDLLRGHVGHWVALPIVVYRALWWAVGLRSYLPYAAMAIGLHLVAAALLRIVMRRSGAGPWIATICASVFVLFGTGAQDILWAFQITFTGALVFGLVHLLLADHSGPVDHRDWLGLAAGLLALMCSAVAITMVIVVAFATLLRRGWRIAALHTVPLAVVFGAWWLQYGRKQKTVISSWPRVFAWGRSGATGVISALGQNRGVGWVLLAALIAGVVIVLLSADLRKVRERGAATLALLLGVLVFLVITGIQRGAVLGESFARSSRYMHILAALLLPSLAVAAQALSRRSRLLGGVVLVGLLVGVPGNISDATSFAHAGKARSAGTRRLMLSIPRMALASKVPPSLRPDPNTATDVTVGWLRAGVASGRIPPPPRSKVPMLTNILRLSLLELDRASGYPCRPLRSPRVLTLEKGDALGVRGSVGVSQEFGRTHSSPVALGRRFPNAALDHTLIAVAGRLRIRVVPTSALGDVLICLPGRVVSGE